MADATDTTTTDARKLTQAVRVHMDVATGILRDTGNRGVIVIVFGEAGFEMTVAARTHEEAGTMARLAKALKDILGDGERKIEAIRWDQIDHEVNPQEGGGTGVVGTSG